MADVGASTTPRSWSGSSGRRAAASCPAARQLRRRLVELLADRGARPATTAIDLRHSPTVIMVAGVNGTGKTTTIGKLAWHLRKEQGQTVVLGAADTFRAAAVEQLEEWAQRAGCEIVKGEPGSDPGSVAFEAVAAGRERGADVVIVDTAGRLHTQDELMAELTKVRRVIAQAARRRAARDAADVDATTGQNGLRQARLFAEAAPYRDRADEARRDREGRDRARHRARARHPGEADRHRRAARGPAPVRPIGVRAGAAGSRPRQTPCKGGSAVRSGEMDDWVIWLVAAVILAAGEIATTSFFLAPFAIGALLAAIAALLGAPAAVSWVLFTLATVASFAFVRPVARRHLQQGPAHRTGTAALIGRNAIVLERVSHDGTRAPSSSRVRPGRLALTTRTARSKRARASR